MRATVLLVVVNVVVFAAMLVAAGMGGVMGFPTDELLRFGGTQSYRVLDDGEVWRLVSATLVHLNAAHLALNMVALVQVGRVLEPRWGTARVLATYVVAGVAGALTSVLRYRGTGVVSVGASGAICGLIGATAVAGHLVGGERGLKLRNAMLSWLATVGIAGFLLGADNAAHAGGLVAGAAVGFAVEKVGVARRGDTVVDGAAMMAFLALAGVAFGLALFYHQPFNVF